MYSPNPARYDRPEFFRRCGKSGLLLPRLSLGLWHNFGAEADYQNARALVHRAFDHGITHFDLANNYGPPPGSAEVTFGRILKEDFAEHRDELIISTKAGYLMWPGPYGDWGSRKYLLSSLDQSLRRMGIDYVDIFYHHRPDPNTPLEETAGALAHAVRSGKALYVGISNYRPAETRRMAQLLRELGTPCLIHQPRYNLMDRWVEDGLLDVLEEEGIGCIPFSPLAQGVLTNRYLNGIPADARAAGHSVFLKEDSITDEKVAKVRALNEIAQARGLSVAQLSLAWVLRDSRITTCLIGASKPDQITDCVKAAYAGSLTADELAAIDAIFR